jgi:aminopeptidase-like protein
LTYGECVLSGVTEDEVLISTHCCHPSLANDNLSAIAVAVGLARHLHSLATRRYTYRFLFLPGTIGAITWLARNDGGATARIRHGLVLTGLGDRGPLTYKRSRRGSALIDRAAAHVLRCSGRGGLVRDFSPWGYDERQYCSPGFDLPVGRLSRTPHGEYPEYHTSADGLSFVRPESLDDSLAALAAIVEILEHDGQYINPHPKGEPQLGRRGLYRNLGGAELPEFEHALLWVLSASDGGQYLLEIADRAGLPFSGIRRAAEELQRHGLLRAVHAVP